MLLTRRGLPGADRWLAPLLAEALQQAGQPPNRALPRDVEDLPGVVEWCWLEDRAQR